MIAERFFMGRRTESPARGEPGDGHTGNIGEIVDAVADQCHRVPGVSRHELNRHQHHGGRNGGAEDSAHGLAKAMGVLRMIVAMRMHVWILPVVRLTRMEGLLPRALW